MFLPASFLSHKQIHKAYFLEINYWNLGNKCNQRNMFHIYITLGC